MISSINVDGFGGSFLPPVANAAELIRSIEMIKVNFKVFIFIP
tara:strand:+ start:614 stop:742 length:129 start_codon:yes stop_codon:yes gene_type:complete